MDKGSLDICNECYGSNENSCIESLEEAPEGFIAKNCREMKRIKIKDQTERAIEGLQNIRAYSIAYTPIVEGIDEVLRILKGRE